MAVARVKKPHRLFLPGDLVVGNVANGMGDNLRCWGWSSKLNRLIGGHHGYYMRYCGHVSPPKWACEAWSNTAAPSKGGNGEAPRAYLNGRGHLRIVKWFDNLSIDQEHLPQPRDSEAWLRRLLLELSCGNMPLSRKEAAPSERILLY